MKVIVGLGNPGHTYHHTRHNIGFRVIQLLAQRHGVSVTNRVVSPSDQRPAGVYGDYRAGNVPVRLLMPLTMMNESGEALKALPAQTADLLVVCDDVNLPVGALRLRPGGSDGGHHGLASCVASLGTEAFARLRVGVGALPLPDDLHEFVLSPVTPDERPAIERSIAQAADACEAWATSGIEVAMNQYNRAQDPA